MFTPQTPLESAIHAGDAAATLDLLRTWPEAERHAQRAGLMRMLKLVQAARWTSQPGEWGDAPTQSQQDSLAAAIVLCGTANDVREAMVDDELLVRLGQEFRPRSLDGVAEVLLQHSPQWIRTVQRLIAAGLAPRPDTDDYSLGLIALPSVMRGRLRLPDAFAADPGLKPALLRVFSVEGTSDVSLASVDKYNHDPATAWGALLLSLVDEGHTTRAELLSLTLGALEKDWPQHRSGWFSRFHGELAPDAAAMRVHLHRYLGLCRSRIPPTVTLALEALRTLDADAPIDGGALLEALRPVMASSVKAHLEAAMKLLDRLVQREPSRALQASGAAAMGLLHEAPSVHASVIKRLQAWGVDDAVRRQLAEHAPRVAALHQPALRALIGEPQGPADAGPVGVDDDAPLPPSSASPTDGTRALAPLADLHELVECVAHVFEHSEDVESFERAVAALVSAAPIPPTDRPLFAPVLKRTARAQRLLPRELARLLVFVLDGTRQPGHAGHDHGGNVSSLEALLNLRIDALMQVASHGRHVTPLSAPTHRGGFIAPETFIERLAAHAAAGVVSPEIEQTAALLRLAPAAPEQLKSLLTQTQRLPDTPLTRALRHALGDEVAVGPEVELWAAAARIRHPRDDDAAVARRHPGLGPDGAQAARYTWQTHSRSHTYDGKTYTHHDLLIDVQDAVADAPEARWAVRRHPPPDERRRYYRWWSFAGIDEGAVRYVATVLPSDPEAFFAEGARAIGNNLDWSEAQWQNRAYLELLLDPVTPITPMACLLLALGLAGKEPGQTATAIDALVHLQSRGDANAAALLADTLRALLSTPLLKRTRLVKSLQAALRASPSSHTVIFQLLCAAVQAQPDEPPRDLAALLELMLELKAGRGRALPTEAREALAAMKLSANARALQKQLLG